MLDIRRRSLEPSNNLVYGLTAYDGATWGPWAIQAAFFKMPFLARDDDFQIGSHVDFLLGRAPTGNMPFTGNSVERQALLSNASNFLSSWTFNNAPDFEVLGENAISHVSLRGSVLTDPMENWRDEGYSSRDAVMASMDSQTMVLRPAGREKFPDYYGYSEGEMISYLRSIPLVCNESSLFFESSGGWLRYVPRWDYLRRGNSASLKFCVYQLHPATDTHIHIVAQWSIHLDRLSFVPEELETEYPLTNFYKVTGLRNYFSSGFYYPGSSVPLFGGRASADYNALGFSFPYGNLGWGSYFDWPDKYVYLRDSNEDSDVAYYLIGYERATQSYRNISGNAVSFTSFEHKAADLAPDILSMAGYAMPKVLEASIAGFGINQLENVQGVSSLFGLVDVRKLLWAAIRVGDRANVLRSMIDILTDARLCYSYALSPTKKDVLSIVGGAKEYRHRWLNGGNFDSTALRGSETFYIPATLRGDFPEMVLKVHLKVVGNYNPDNFLPSLLPLDAVGLLPRFSTFWAVIPFSFVLDNVINITRMMKLVETTLMAPAVFRADYTVYSATLIAKLNYEQAIVQTLVTEPFAGDVEYRAYNRWVIPTMPFIQPSRIAADLLVFNVPSDWMTYGSLAYKVLL